MSELNQQSAAWLVGLTARTLRDSNAPRNPDATYNAKHLLQWQVARNSVQDEMLSSGGDSPALEEYRRARAKLAVIEVAEKTRVVLPREVVRGVHARWAAILRRAGESLQKRFGPDAFSLFTDAIDECQRLVNEEFGPNAKDIQVEVEM